MSSTLSLLLLRRRRPHAQQLPRSCSESTFQAPQPPPLSPSLPSLSSLSRLRAIFLSFCENTPTLAAASRVSLAFLGLASLSSNLTSSAHRRGDCLINNFADQYALSHSGVLEAFVRWLIKVERAGGYAGRGATSLPDLLETRRCLRLYAEIRSLQLDLLP